MDVFLTSKNEKVKKFVFDFFTGFHSCVGGCNGCINLNEVDNMGFEDFSVELEKTYKKLGLEKIQVSRADFWALTAIIATESAINKHGG